ncbi:MAG: DUF2279 domain-containing protein [Ginsengibacter sp.]
MKLFCIIFSLFLLVSIAQSGQAQKMEEQGFLPASANFDRQRFNVVILSEAGISTLATIGLEFLWYKKFPKSRFHFFNDNNEWLNMDKVGHATSAYNIAAVQYNVMRWTGVNKTTSLWVGIATALGYMTMIEVSDGFSKEWGFSPGDMIANVSGVAMFGAQQAAWHQQRILMQFSYHNSIFSKYNPGELGRNLPQRILKDYNGQSYWLSFNMSSFMGKTNFPKWITANLGYGASGMISAVHNPSEVNGKNVPSFLRERKLFLGVSGAFTANNATIYPSWLNILKIPAPVAQWNLTSDKISFRPLYY